MQHALEYSELKQKKKEPWQINHVRLKKGALLWYELVGAKGKMQTDCHGDTRALSPIKWPVYETLNAEITRG